MGAIEINRFNGTNILFLDECHEDSKELGAMLFHAREALDSKHCPDVQVAMMSATPDVNALAVYYADFSSVVMTMTLKVFKLGGHKITKVHQRHQQQQPHATRPLRVLPFHASQAHAEHELVFEPFPEGRKVIVATNMAESSLTIGNLKLVFDACTQKVKYFDFAQNAFELRTERACKNALVQRAGPVGGTSSGHVIRMCTEAEFESQAEFNDAAVTRTPIDDVLLTLLVCTACNASFRDLLSTDRFMHPPSPAAQQHALKLLVDLGAITCSNPVGEPLQLSQATVTPKGRKMSLMPLPTELAYMLLTVPVLHARLPMLKAAAMLSIAGATFVMPRHDPEDPGLVKRAHASIRRFKSGPSDHLTLVNVLHEYQQQEGDKKSRDDWCERNFVNAHSLYEADLIFEQLFASLQKHDKKRWLFDDIKSFKSNNVPNDLSIALLEAYTANLAVRCRAAITAQQDALDRLEEGCQNVPDLLHFLCYPK
ncbi:P-loop containing nucleoside triphosphate hydrolase protein [Gongronella butleri]|nr:P-loop containing nucleoside triphosphate hydrolase protein [Gongronella butleri]